MFVIFDIIRIIVQIIINRFENIFDDYIQNV